MQCSLPYGTSAFQLSLPEAATVISAPDPPSDVSRESFQLGISSLIQKNSGITGQVAIVVADKTRLCGYEYALLWLTEALQSFGIDDNQIVFYIAYGTHQKQSDVECYKAYGDAYRKYLFIHHDCTSDSMAFLGKTKRGTRAFIRKDILEAELIITFGAVSHHYFAGYGGGRKLLFPGLAGRDGIYHNHGLYLDKNRLRLEPDCFSGNLKGNPLAEDLEEINDLVPHYVSIHGLINSQGKVIRYFFGSNYRDFLSICRQQDELYRVSRRTRYDLVAASAGGHPKDINFIQAHKALHNCAAFVKDEGTLILLAECRDQIGSTTFLPWLAKGYTKSFEQLRKNYEGNGGTALAMMEKTQRIKIGMVTCLDHETCQKCNVEKISLDQLRDLIKKCNGDVGVITNGAMLV